MGGVIDIARAAPLALLFAPVLVALAAAQPSPPLLAPCASMPASGPIRVRYALHDYEAPERLRRFVIFDRDQSCLPDPMPGHMLGYYAPQVCVPVPPAELARLRAELDRFDVRSIRARTEGGVHRGGVAIELEWSAGSRASSCRIADITSEMRVVDADRERFRAAAEAVRSTIERALARP